MGKKYILLIVLCGVLALSGCTIGSTIEGELSNVLAEMHEAEKPYRDGQKELNAIEKNEQSLFNETMDLTQDESDKLKTNISQMEEMLEQRITYINEEEKSMKSAMKFMSDIEGIANSANGDAKAEIEKLKEAIQHRYQTHSAFVDEYKELTHVQDELYEMLLKEDIDLGDLEKQVEELNNRNDEVTSWIKKFNEATITLNQTKDKAFDYFKKNESE